MPFLKPLIDVVTLGSERPIRRLLAYYAILALVIWALARFFPGTEDLLVGRGADNALEVPSVLQDGLSQAAGESMFGHDSLVRLVASTTVILVGTLLLMLPVSWVYMSARSVTGHSQAIVQTLVILPLVVAGIVIIVQHSLALAFSLAGVVAAVRFRATLRDTRDVVFIFLSIAVGFAAGVQSLAVGAILSVVFNLVLLFTWRYDYGRNVLTPTASARWSEPLDQLANPTIEHEVPDRDLILSLSPAEAGALAERFERVSDVLGKKKKKPRYNAVLSVATNNVGDAQQAVQEVLDKVVRRWRLDEVVTNVGKPSEIHYLIRLKKSVMRDQVLTAIHDKAAGLITTANVELGERIRDSDEKD
ncbi:MAG TPA: DUF4956 domain-containing protein [Gemmatimonadaceae bacterium]|nr:DUF4956 domain-containing protein [Gemmatimonadaceae bacterium]